MTKPEFIAKIISTPGLIFLVDALGALISSLLLLLVLVPLEHYFGIPVNVLHYLGAIAVCLFIYSFSCYKLIKTDWKPYLKAIIMLNISYSLLSIGLIIAHYHTVKPLGIAYLVLELVVIGYVISLEYQTLRSQISDTSAISDQDNSQKYS